MAAIPAPLTIGRIELADGTFPQGFLCEAYAVDGAQEITHWGGGTWNAIPSSIPNAGASQARSRT